MNKSYTDGYIACIRDTEDFINHSIQRNGGCKTPTQAVNVLNDVIHHLHYVYSTFEPSVEYEEEVEAVVNTNEVEAVLQDINRHLRDIFGNTKPFTIRIIKGGKD